MSINNQLNSEASDRGPITPTKFSEYSNSLKRSINDLSFTLAPVTKKRFLKTQDNSFPTQILSKLDLLSDTADSQTAYIIALEKPIKELTPHFNGNTKANKANQVAANLRQWQLG